MSQPNDLVCTIYAEEKRKVANKDKPYMHNLAHVLKAVSEYQNINIKAYGNKDRSRVIVDGRKAYVQICTKYLDYSLVSIGKFINRAHDNINYYNKSELPEVKEIINYIENNYILPEKKLTESQKRLIRIKTR